VVVVVVFSVARVQLVVFLPSIFTSYEVRRLEGGSAELKGAALTLIANRKEIAARCCELLECAGYKNSDRPNSKEEKRFAAR
jgi:hypothetical protein